MVLLLYFGFWVCRPNCVLMKSNDPLLFNETFFSKWIQYQHNITNSIIPIGENGIPTDFSARHAHDDSGLSELIYRSTVNRDGPRSTRFYR